MEVCGACVVLGGGSGWWGAMRWVDVGVFGHVCVHVCKS